MLTLAGITFALKRIGYFIIDNWKALAVFAGLALFVVLVLAASKACSRPPKLDQKEVIKAQQAIETNDRKAMIEVLAESKAKEQDVDNSVKAAEEATAAAKRDYSQKTNAELAAELEEKLK